MSADHDPKPTGQEGKEVQTQTLTGNLAKEPVMKTVTVHDKTDASITEHVPVTEFRLVVNGSDGQSTGYQVVAWRGLADKVNQLDLHTGAFVRVTGKLTEEQFTGSDGLAHTARKLTLSEAPIVLRASPGAARRTPPPGGK